MEWLTLGDVRAWRTDADLAVGAAWIWRVSRRVVTMHLCPKRCIITTKTHWYKNIGGSCDASRLIMPLVVSSVKNASGFLLYLAKYNSCCSEIQYIQKKCNKLILMIDPMYLLCFALFNKFNTLNLLSERLCGLVSLKRRPWLKSVSISLVSGFYAPSRIVFPHAYLFTATATVMVVLQEAPRHSHLHATNCFLIGCPRSRRPQF